VKENYLQITAVFNDPFVKTENGRKHVRGNGLKQISEY
jgi:hypothetical protein